jgi:catechol 2,3-dioxygenase-like lactoylglutathione lyase family enzyme
MIDWKRLDHVQLCIPPNAEGEAREFYALVLDLEEIPKPEALRANGGLWFRVGDVELHLGVEDVDAPLSKRHPAFEVANVARARTYLENRGVEIRDETPIPGRERFSFRDPFGNRLELFETV